MFQVRNVERRLYFRLAVVRLVPSLAERREDIPLLAERFIDRFNAKRGKRIRGFTPAAMELLMRYDFPGNVRQLENTIEFAFVLCHEHLIDVCHLPDEVQQSAPEARAKPRGLDVAEADAVRSALRRCRGHVTRAAAELGISRATLWRKMKRYRIVASDYRRR